MKQFLNDEIFKNIFVFIEKNPTCHFFNIARGGGISWIYCLDMKFYIFGPDLIMDFLFSVIRVNKNNINELEMNIKIKLIKMFLKKVK